MHAMVTLLTKNANSIYKVIDDFTYDETNINQDYYWDYASVGGRFHGLIPVSEKTKIKIYGDVFGVPHMDDEFQFQDMNYEHAPRVKYVSCARLRNIDKEELNRMKTCLNYDIFNPYAFIVEDDGEFVWIENDPIQPELRDADQLTWVYNTLSDPKKQHWYVTVIDCHI